MKTLRNLIFAMSLYTRLPLRLKNAKEEDCAHVLVFLPLAGLVAGAALYGAYVLITGCELPLVFSCCALSLIPLVITGGFHVDGFMDVQDARSSYKSREEKLAILKDPHIGAFAVIRLLMLAGCWIACLSLLLWKEVERLLLLHAISFVTVRAACGLTALLFPHAKREGMLEMESAGSKTGDVIILALTYAIAVTAMCVVHPLGGLCSIAALLLFAAWYHTMCKKEFGGVTGDTSGYFVTVGEALILIVLACLTWI